MDPSLWGTSGPGHQSPVNIRTKPNHKRKSFACPRGRLPEILRWLPCRTSRDAPIVGPTNTPQKTGDPLPKFQANLPGLFGHCVVNDGPCAYQKSRHRLNDPIDGGSQAILIQQKETSKMKYPDPNRRPPFEATKGERPC